MNTRSAATPAKLILEPLRCGQSDETALDFGFLGGDGRHWPCRRDLRGRSIDAERRCGPCWERDPWEGQYREASVVHDSSLRRAGARIGESVHRVFYLAMLVSGVSIGRAKLVYAGAYFAGPRWEDVAVGSLRGSAERTPPPQTARRRDPVRALPRPDRLAVSEAVECDGMSAFDRITSVGTTPADSNSGITLRAG